MKNNSYIIQSSDNIQELETYETLKVRAVSDFDIRQIILKHLRYSKSQADFCKQIGAPIMRLHVYLRIPDSEFPRASKGLYEAVCKYAMMNPYVEIRRLAKGCKIGGPDARALNYGIPLDKFVSKYCEMDPNGTIVLEELFRAYALTVSKETDMLYTSKWTFLTAIVNRFNVIGEKLPNGKTISMVRGIRFNPLGEKTFHYWGYSDTEKTLMLDEIVHEFVFRYCEIGVQFTAKSEDIRNAWHAFLKELDKNNQLVVPTDSPISKMLNRFYGSNCKGSLYYGIRLKGHPNARDPYEINVDVMPKNYADKLIEWRYQHPRVLRNFVDEKKNNHREVTESHGEDSAIV